MVEKVSKFPIEKLYYLESEDFLLHREKFYFRKDKTIKLNSFWLGVSRLRVNNDKLLYLFNGLRGYYDVRTRFLKEPKMMIKRVPMSKMILVNDYLVKKYKYSDLFIYSLNEFNRPTIILKKKDYKNIYYSFSHRLVEYLNTTRDIKNVLAVNAEYYVDSRDLKHVNLRFKMKPKKKFKNFRFLNILPAIVLGMKEIFWFKHYFYFYFLNRQKAKVNNLFFNKKIFAKKRVIIKKYFIQKIIRKRIKSKEKNKRKFFAKKTVKVLKIKVKIIKRKLKKMKRFYKTRRNIKLLFVAARKYLRKKEFLVRKKMKINKFKKSLKAIALKKSIFEKKPKLLLKSNKKNNKINKLKKNRVKKQKAISKKIIK